MVTTRNSPTVRRRIVASELRRLRKLSEKTQGEVEQALGLSNNALSRYENCKSSMQGAVAKSLFGYYGVEGDRLDALVELARGSRQQGWLKSVADVIPPWFEDFIVLERDASEIYELALSVIPGVLQTEDYARAVLRGGVLGSEVNDHVRTRMERAANLREPGAPQFWGIIRESVLHCEVGGRSVMRSQLEHLVNLAQSPDITVLVIPNQHGAHMSMLTSFILMRFDIAPEFGVVYTEHLGGALYQDEPAEVQLYDNAYRHLIKAALPEEQSVQLIKKTIKDIYA